MKFLDFIRLRGREPSTYTSFAVFLGALGVNVDPGIVQTVAYSGLAVSGILGIVLPEATKE